MHKAWLACCPNHVMFFFAVLFHGLVSSGAKTTVHLMRVDPLDMLPQQQLQLKSDAEVPLHAHYVTNEYGHPSWLSQCRKIYLDVGSNIGVQIRKLFEPEKYPRAPILPVFDRIFGSATERANQTNVCALGLEPNPLHTKRLAEVESNAVMHGWRVHFYPYAAWKVEGTMKLNMRLKDLQQISWNANLDEHCTSADCKTNATVVRTIDLAKFIESLPADSVKLMKMDIEGAEYETVASMLQAKTLCRGVVDMMLIESHNWGDITTWKDNRTYESLQRRVQDTDCQGRFEASPTTMVQLDDESYMHDDGREGDESPPEPSCEVHCWFSNILQIIRDNVR
mmetsp:Transcript_6174/g.11407  ORF Transcript_6174/g.11407 Transcript_6174/m.11407 type:complete len:338 (-) Transcript_6174:13-1026(-)